MPKSLHEWLHYQALKWWMPTEAVQAHIGGLWHRASGDQEWTVCGRWVAGQNKRRGAGYGPSRYRRRAPWSNEGSVKTTHLCRRCFADELPILELLERVAVHGANPFGDTGEKI